MSEVVQYLLNVDLVSNLLEKPARLLRPWNQCLYYAVLGTGYPRGEAWMNVMKSTLSRSLYTLSPR
ncbi:MAG: hypothetical protein ACP5UZ_09035 [Thermoplasmata archaeon]